MARVFIIAGVKLYGEGLAECLGQDDEITVIGVEYRLGEALKLIEDLKPDAVLFDTTISWTLEGIRNITRQGPNVELLALSVPEDEEVILDLVKVGISSYVTCDASLADLRAEIIGTLRGEASCSPRIARTLFAEMRRMADASDTPEVSAGASDRLTRREGEILGCIEQGMSNKEIANELSIGVSTVKNHVHNLLEKLRVNRRGEAAALARQQQPRLAAGSLGPGG